MPKDIQGKIVLITGGATGIGRAAALEYASLGAKVVVTTGHNVAGGQKVVEEIRAQGGEAMFIQCDVSSEESVERCISQIVETYGRLDIAFNNAGVGPDGVRMEYRPLTEFPESDWDKIVDTNLKGTFFCLKYELRQMQKQGKGSIVNTSSIAGLKPAPNFGGYCPSKAGVVSLTQVAALENCKNNIRINVVCPGPTVGTELMKNSMATGNSGQEDEVPPMIPLGKYGKAEDVAAAAVWLSSDLAGHITGQVVSVDGGMHMA